MANDQRTAFKNSLIFVSVKLNWKGSKVSMEYENSFQIKESSFKTHLEFGICDLIIRIIFYDFISPFSQFQFRLRRYIKHSRHCTKANNSKLVKNTLSTRRIFNSLLGVGKRVQTQSFVFDILHHNYGTIGFLNPILQDYVSGANRKNV